VARDAAIASELNGVSGQLVTIDSAYENSLVQSFATGLNRSVLIGASDATVEGEWRWQQGYEDDLQFWSGTWAAEGGAAVPAMYSNWNTLEPNNSTDEHAALLRPSDGKWNDIATDRFTSYVIEWDANAVLSSFQYSLQNDPSGAFSIDSSTGALTLGDASRIDYETATSHDIVVRLTDASGEYYDETVKVQITDAVGPLLANIETTTLPYVENSGAVAISDNVTVNNTVSSATIRVLNSYIVGEDTLSFSDTPTIFHSWDGTSGTLTLSGSGTTAEWQLALRSVTYTNGSDDPTGGNRTIQFSATNSDDSSNIVNRTINVTPVNDAPTIGTTSPLTVTEDSTNPAGQTVSNIFGASLSDIDGNVLGIAIINDATTTEGQWQYSTDTGANWYPFQVNVSDTNALVLGVDSLLRFVPAADYHGAIPALTTVAVDDTQGGVLTVDNLRVIDNTSTRGGITAYSGASAQIEGTVTPVFDVPTNVGSVPLSFTVTEDSGTDLDLSSVEIDSRDHIGDLTLRLSTQTGGLLAARSDPAVSINSSPGSVELTASATALNDYLDDPSSITYLHGTSNTHGTAADTLVIELEYGSTNGIMANPAIHITSVNDAPLTADSTLNMVEDTPYTLALSDFEFSDPHDGNNLLAIQIVSIPLNLSLLLNGVAVSSGDIISTTDVSAGNLTLHPQTNTFGSSYDSLRYRVQDDGGIANSGDDTSDNIATMTIDIAAVNDMPGFTVSPLPILRGESASLTSHIVAIDPDVEPDQRVITLNNEPAHGSLQRNGVTLTTTESFTQADVDAGTVRYLHDGTEAIDDSLLLSFSDLGADATNLTMLQILDIPVTETHPQPEPDSAAVDEGGLINVPVLDNDQPADEPLDAFSTTVVQAPLHGNAFFDVNGVATYEHNGGETTSDSFSYTVTDSGGQVSDPVTVSITINPVNDIPELLVDPSGLAVPRQVTEQSTPVVISPSLRIVDAELTLSDNFDGSTLQLQRDTGASAEDQFSAAAPALDPLTDGGNIVLHGDIVGSVLHNAGGSLLLQFNAAATDAIVNEVASSIGYSYSGDTPPASLTLQWQFNDANTGLQGSGGAHTVNGVVGVDITATNDAPLLTVGGNLPIHTEAANAVPIAPLINITDAELDLLDTTALPVITLQRTGGANAQDEFVDSGQLGPLAPTAAFTDAGIQLGTIIDRGPGVLQIVFDAGVDTAQISSALQQIAYRYAGDAPPPQVSLQWTFSDGNSGAQGVGGAETASIESVVTILATDDPPVISGLATTILPYSHRSPAIALASSIELIDPDSTTLSRASVWIQDHQPGIDNLAVTSPGSLTLNWDADSGVLTLEGPADLAAYQSALRTLTYQSHDLPAATETLRSIQVQIVDDTGSNSNTEPVEVLLTVPENPLVVTVNQTLQILTGEKTTIEPLHLRAIDIYSDTRAEATIVFRLNALPDAGTLLLNEQPLAIGDLFTQQDIQEGNVAYLHTAGTAGALLNTDSAQPINQFTLQDLNNGLVLLRHDGSEENSVTLQLLFQHRDGDELTRLDTQPVELTVIDVADPPTGVDSNMTTDHINPLIITEQQLGFDDTDDGDVLVAMQINAVPAHGSLQLSGTPLDAGAKIDIQLLRDGQLSYVPDPLTRGTIIDNISFTLIDSGNPNTGGSNQSTRAHTIEVAVTSDHEPQATPDTIRIEEGGVATQLQSGAYRVTDNDTDWDTATENLLVQLLREPEFGTLTLNHDGTFRYNHNGDESRRDSFSYRAVDDTTELSGTEGSVTTVEIDIEPRNDAPEAGTTADQWLQATEFLQLELPTDLFVDRDPGDTLTLSATLADGSPLPAWLSFDPATYVFSGIPDPTATGTLEILVVATDSAGATAPQWGIDDFGSSISPPTVERTDEDPDQKRGTVLSNHSLTLASEASVSGSEKEQEDELRLDRETNSLSEMQTNATTKDRLLFFEDRVVRHNKGHTPEKTVEAEEKIIAPVEVAELPQVFIPSESQALHISNPGIQELNRIKDELNASAETTQAIVVSGTIVSTGLSVGYIIWLIRGGLLLGSVMSSMPAWCFVDPLPVLRDLGNNNEEDDKESLQSLVDHEDSAEKNQPSANTATNTTTGEGGPVDNASGISHANQSSHTNNGGHSNESGNSNKSNHG